MAASRATYILAIDQGTTSTRAMVFDAAGKPCAQAQRELQQHYPQPGWVEHDAEEIWQATLDTCRAVLAELALAPKQVAAIGITNQRETTLVWERKTGRPIARAIVWQDRRTAARCAELTAAGHDERARARTGLVIDPYFSATKIAWLLDNIPGARPAAERGELAFGTIDCFLLWRLSGGTVHATYATNAARTLLFDIHRQDWDDELLALFRVPRALLPDVRDNAAEFGGTAAELFGAPIAVAGMAGDQQAATIGQACFAPGMIKSTYGTGCFAVLNAGAAVQWLRDGLKLIARADESDALARAADPARRVYVVPAFTGLGAPYWDADARGAIFGLTRDVGRAELVRATLEASCYQTRDLIEAMRADGAAPQSLRVDGGMVVNDWFVQCLADTLGLPVERPRFIETTVLGAAALAGLGCGLYPSLEALAGRWQRDRLFEPRLDAASREAAYAGWRDAVARVRSAR